MLRRAIVVTEPLKYAAKASTCGFFSKRESHEGRVDNFDFSVSQETINFSYSLRNQEKEAELKRRAKADAIRFEHGRIEHEELMMYSKTTFK